MPVFHNLRDFPADIPYCFLGSFLARTRETVIVYESCSYNGYIDTKRKKRIYWKVPNSLWVL